MTTTAPIAPIAPASTLPSPSLHLPDAVRGVMPLVALGVIAKYTLVNPHLIFGPVAWIAFIGAVGLTVAATARIWLADAPAPRRPTQRVERTRRVSVLQEVAIAGGGSFLVLAPALVLMATTSREVWAGHVEPAQPSLLGFLVALAFGVAGFFMLFFRPQFVLDRAAGTIVRYPFARSIPWATTKMRYAELVVYSERHVHPSSFLNRDFIRGEIGGKTFELEILHGDGHPEVVQARTLHWAHALGARYLPQLPVAGAR